MSSNTEKRKQVFADAVNEMISESEIQPLCENLQSMYFTSIVDESNNDARFRNDLTNTYRILSEFLTRIKPFSL